MSEALPILIIEDSDNDILLLTLAFKRAGILNPVHIAHDGKEAIEYLQGMGIFEDRQKYPFPSVILTDLKMPRMSGFEVLEWLRVHPECSVIPVIILSASRQGSDIKRAYQLGANSYLVKPSTLDELQNMMKLTFDYWLVCEKPAYPARC